MLDSSAIHTQNLKETQVSENEVVITTEKKKKKRGGLALIIGGAVLVASVGGVFAANLITINSSAGIELGNGVSDTTTCTTDASTTVEQQWSGTANTPYGGFIVKDIKVTGINAACTGKTLKVLLIQTDGQVMCTVDGTHASAVTEANAQDQFTLSADNTQTYTVDLIGNQVPGECLSANVGKVGLETAN
jgi:hypothetical protein